MKKLELPRTKELSNIEIVILTSIYTILSRIDNLKESIINNVDDYKQVIEKSQELRALNNLGLLSDLKKQFWDYATIETLNKIVNNDKFKLDWEYSTSVTIIDNRVLRTFSSYDNVNNDPKGHLAKKLGATITI